MRSLFFPLLLTFFFCACASVPQTHEVRDSPGSLPPFFRVIDVPFISQTENYCGPAALSMLAHHAGLSPTLDELGTLMYTPLKRGTFPTDFLGAARRLGLLAVPIDQLKNLLLELSRGHPVAVLQNFGSDANPLWHYSVAIAYDLKSETLWFHSGKEREMSLDFSQFERTWMRASHWALLALKPSELPASSTPREILLASSALERVGKTSNAVLAYSAILKKWPEESAAYFGLGNAYAQLHEWKRAAQALERASKLDPNEGAIWNNLGEVYLILGSLKKAKLSFFRAKTSKTPVSTK